MEKSQKKKDQKKEDAGARKGRKVAKYCVFSCLCGSGRLKSRLAKSGGCGDIWGDKRWKVARRCGAKPISKWKGTKHLTIGPLLEVEMLEKCTALWREADLEVKCVKDWGVRSTLGSWDVEKALGVVARSRFGSKLCQKLRVSEHFWKLRYWKSARRCGAKHIWKSNRLETEGLGALLEVKMLKKCTAFVARSHLEVKCVKKSDNHACGNCVDGPDNCIQPPFVEWQSAGICVNEHL